MASVFLGSAQLPIKSGNLLSNAFHPKFGWVWTDGQAVHLLTCSDDGLIEDGTVSVKLGDYGAVRRVSWSTHTEDSTRCYLAVQELNLVTIWEVFGEKQKPEFKVIKKIEGNTDLKDIIWHPICPILCLVSSSGSWLHSLDPDWSVHLGREGTLSGCWTPEGRTLVLAGDQNILIYRWEDISRCKDDWIQKRLVIERFKGKIRCTKAVSSRLVIAMTDLPLTEVIKQSNQDTFIPLVVNSTPPSNRKLITEISDTSTESLTTSVTKQVSHSIAKLEEPCRADSTNMVDSLKDEIMKRKKGPVDLTAMLTVFSPKNIDGEKTVLENLDGKETTEVLERNPVEPTDNKRYEKDVNSSSCKGDEDGISGRKTVVGASPLFLHETFVKKEELNVTRQPGWNAVTGGGNPRHSSVPIFKKAEMTDLEASAHIHILDVSSEVLSIVNSSKVPQMLSPDLVTFEPRSNNLYVGSRSKRHLQVYNIRNGNLMKANDNISLDDHERPVGIQCGSHEEAVSVLVSKPAALCQDAIFPMATGTQQVDLYLKQYHLV